MAGKENPSFRATREVVGFIYEISKSLKGGLNNLATEAYIRLNRRELLIAPNNSQFNIPTSVGFDLKEIPSQPDPKFAPVVVIDVEKVLGGKKEIVKADLARTVAVAVQYPYQGYERRYRAVYEDALKVQTRWLQENEASEVPFDPRTVEKEMLLTGLLGDASFYSDVGFEDWQKAIDEYKRSEIDISANRRLDQLKHEIGDFLIARQRFTPQNQELATESWGEQYQKWDANYRARLSASSLLALSLYEK